MPTAGYDAPAHLEGLVVHGPWQTVTAFVSALVGTPRGLLLFTPVAAVAIVALIVERRRLPGWTLAATIAGLCYLLVQVRAVGPLGGDQFFGARISLEALVLATPALTVAAYRMTRRSRLYLVALVVTALASVSVHAYGATARSVAPVEGQRWERIMISVEEEYGDLELSEVDLRDPAAADA